MKLACAVITLAGFFSAAALLLASGLLLSRSSLPGHAACAERYCTSAPRFKRAIIIVVDALRYDFAAPDETNDASYKNKMPFIKKALSQPSHALLLHAKVDAPTTTFQRLKAIATGGLPTLIETGSNFATYAIEEDNLLWQLRDANRSIWSHVYLLVGYHHASQRSAPFPSFNVHDLDTVDRGVAAALLSEAPLPGWEVYIAHFLGVDHCGHTHGPSHPQMAKKLREIDAVIAQVARLMDDETLLVVLGDHGMNEQGDHGGDSFNETDAALFFFAKSAFVDNDLGAPTTTEQIDITSTLAFLLGVPIPQNNMGSVIPQLVGTFLSDALSANARQVKNFYSRRSAPGAEREFSDQQVAEFDRLFTASQQHLDEKQYVESRQRFLRTVLAAGRQQWVQFDNGRIIIGIVLLAVIFAVAVLVLARMPGPSLFAASLLDTLAFFCVLLKACGFGSVFFMQHEDLLTFILFCVLIGGVFFRGILSQGISIAIILRHKPALAAFVIVVFTSAFGICRDDLLDCTASTPDEIYSMIALASFFYFQHWWLKRHSNCFGGAWLYARLLLPIIFVSIGFFWTSNARRMTLQEESTPEPFMTRSSSMITRIFKVDPTAPSLYLLWPRVVYICIALSAALQLCWPLFVRVISRKRDSEAIIAGLPTVFSASAIMSFTPVAAVWILLLGPGHAFSAVGYLAVLVCILEIDATVHGQGRCNELEVVTQRHVAAAIISSPSLVDDGPQVNSIKSWLPRSIEDLVTFKGIRVSFSTIALWSFAAQAAFFATGHQAILSSIRWGAGLTGLSEMSVIGSGLLVYVEVFGGFVIIALALPLLVSWKFARQARATEPSNPAVPGAHGDFWLHAFHSDEYRRELVRAAVLYMLVSALMLLGAGVSAFALQRHLMMWKLFGPRFFFELGAFLATTTSVAVSIGWNARVRTSLDALTAKLGADKTA